MYALRGSIVLIYGKEHAKLCQKPLHLALIVVKLKKNIIKGISKSKTRVL